MNGCFLELLRDTRRARREGGAELMQRQRHRLAEMVAFARAHSSYYHELYKGLPEGIEDETLLPVTDKKTLMARFDDWVTDREATGDKLRAFIADPNQVGERFLGKYLAATTSGTTGTRGTFLMEDRAMAVNIALEWRLYSDTLDADDLIKIVTGGARMAMVIATGGHFFGAALVTRLLLKSKLPLANRLRVLSVHTPLRDLVSQLNAFRPAILIGYASMIALLADEQQANRLHITPALVQLVAEGLAEGEYERIAAAFGAKVSNKYAATECPFVGYSCEHKWLHVNSDWVVLEPVGADYRPTPVGEQSHTMLLSNLANQVQPFLRYDLGDSVVQRPDPCPCGNPLPAIRLQGRAADVLTFPTEQGQNVSITPLAISSLLESISGVELFQVVQTAPTSLRLRLRLAGDVDGDCVWRAAYAKMKRLLTEHNLGHVTVERTEEQPEQSLGGKFREVIPLR